MIYMRHSEAVGSNINSTGLYFGEKSEWSCHLFSGSVGGTVVWTPLKGREPNWFWRAMQYILFGNKWIREKR